MAVRYFLGPMVDVTLPSRSARGSACFRHWDRTADRISIVKTAGGHCLTRFEATAARLAAAAADPDLVPIPDRDEALTAQQRTRIRAWLADRGLSGDALPVGTTGREVVRAIARRVTGVQTGPLRMGPDDVNGADFG